MEHAQKVVSKKVSEKVTAKEYLYRLPTKVGRLKTVILDDPVYAIVGI
jgi:hypothetical protein